MKQSKYERHAGSDLWRPAHVAVVIVVTLTTGAGAVMAAGGSDGTGSTIPGIVVISPDNDPAVQWQVRSDGPVRLRLYRAQPSGVVTLLSEVETEPGISDFRIVDSSRPPGPTRYLLRLVGRAGSEITLGALFCVERQPTLKTSLAPQGPSQDFAWVVEATELPAPVLAELSVAVPKVAAGFIPGPEPPIPRQC